MICVRYADDSVVGFERFFFSSRRRHTRCSRDWSSDVCSSDLGWSLGPVLAFYACFTGALLSKGPQALAALAAAGVAVAFTDGTAMLRRLRPVLGSVLAFGVATIVWLLPYQARSQGSFDDQVLTGHYLTWYLLGPILPRFTALWAPLPSFLPWTLLVAAAPFWWRQSPDAGRRRIALWTATL